MNGITWPDIRIFFRMSGQLHRMSGYIFGCSDFYFSPDFRIFFRKFEFLPGNPDFFNFFVFSSFVPNNSSVEEEEKNGSGRRRQAETLRPGEQPFSSLFLLI